MIVDFLLYQKYEIREKNTFLCRRHNNLNYLICNLTLDSSGLCFKKCTMFKCQFKPILIVRSFKKKGNIFSCFIFLTKSKINNQNFEISIFCDENSSIFWRLIAGKFYVFVFSATSAKNIANNVYIFWMGGASAFKWRVNHHRTTSVDNSTGPWSVPKI